MPARVLIGEFKHETNTFASEPTTRASFRRRREYVGDAMLAELEGTNTAVGGAIDAAGEGVELLPTVAANAAPGGPVSSDAYERYTGLITDAAREHAEELDGVLLALHGAMVPAGLDDGEGPLMRELRGIVGDGVPIVATFDLHGNVTDEMVATGDALVAFETYPHVDMAETGRTAMAVLERIARGEADPVVRVERPPVLPFGPRQNTREGPMAEVMARARALEEREEILKVNVFPGFHAAAVPEMGFSVPVVADGDPGAARDAAREIARLVWELRESFVGSYPEPRAAVDRALDLASANDPGAGPVVLADAGDNPGGGGAADGTPVLGALLERVTDERAGFAIMRDPEVVARCVDAGVGERVTATVGGKTDDRHGDPIEAVEGYVKAITDGVYVNTGPMERGVRNDLGRAVRWDCGPTDGVSVILAENRVQPFDAAVFRHVGIQPERLDLLVVKSTNHFRADFEPLSSAVLPVNSPGLSSLDPRRYEYDRIRRPQFPLDEMSEQAYPDWE